MRLSTRNGWILTNHTAYMLSNQFDGTEEELINYALKNDLSIETFSKDRNDNKKWIVKPRIYLGSYDLWPNSDGIIATSE